jgi:SAM-dependent methyltransferase
MVGSSSDADEAQVAVDVEIDLELLKSEIKRTYASVSTEPDQDFIFPTGRAWAEDLDYPEELANVPERAVRDERFDVVISNGVIDLIPDKDAVFSQLHRVLVPGGRMQIADVTIQNPGSAEGRRNIDLWTG